MIRKVQLGLILLLVGFSSCVHYDDLISLRDAKEKFQYENQFNAYPLLNYRIRPFDQLFISIKNLEENTSEFLNIAGTPNLNAPGRSTGSDNPNLYLLSYVVNDSGYVKIPLIGSVYVKGRTLAEIKIVLDQRIKPFLKFASTSVRLTNFRVSVIGEVNQPGVQSIYNDKTTLLQVIGKAGDMTDFANRKRVKIIRESDFGTETAFLDFTDPESILTSEYYFVLPNDVIYVEPTKAKATSINIGTAGLVISAITLAAVIANSVLTAIDNN